MKNQILYYLAVACVFLTVFAGCCYAAADAGKSGSDTSDNEDDIQVDEKQVEYAKGSLCGYCEYCKVGSQLNRCVLCTPVFETKPYFFCLVISVIDT